MKDSIVIELRTEFSLSTVAIDEYWAACEVARKTGAPLPDPPPTIPPDEDVLLGYHKDRIVIPIGRAWAADG